MKVKKACDEETAPGSLPPERHKKTLVHQLIIQLLLIAGTAILTSAAGSAGQVPFEIRAMTLDACIETALEKNPGLRVATEEEALQAQEISVARSAFYPRVDALAGYTRFEYPQRVFPAHENNEPGVFDQDLLESGLVLRLPLYRGGQRRADLTISQLGRLRAVELWKSTRRDLILNLHALFYNILQLDNAERSARTSMLALETHKKTTLLQLDVGRVAPVDVMKIDVRLADIEQRLSAILADRKTLITALSQLIGLRPFASNRPNTKTAKAA